jgi:hypothetical protein
MIHAKGNLSIEGNGATIALAVFAQEVLDKVGIGQHAFFLAIVTIDEYYQVGGVERDFCAFMVAGRRAYTAFCIAINGQTSDV